VGAPNVYLRGGLPVFLAKAVPAGGLPQEWHWRGVTKTAAGTEIYGTANWFRFENTGGGAGDDILLSFSQADADAGVGITLAANAVLEAPLEIGRFWTFSTLGSTFTAMVTMRRGG
jgi:hypothetical protein